MSGLWPYAAGVLAGVVIAVLIVLLTPPWGALVVTAAAPREQA